MQRGYLVDWDQLFSKRKWKHLNSTGKALSWGSCGKRWSHQWSGSDEVGGTTQHLFPLGPRSREDVTGAGTTAQVCMLVLNYFQETLCETNCLDVIYQSLCQVGWKPSPQQPGCNSVALYCLLGNGLSSLLWVDGFADSSETKWRRHNPQILSSHDVFSCTNHSVAACGVNLPMVVFSLG